MRYQVINGPKSDTAEMLIYGTIGMEISSEQCLADLAGIKATNLTVRIHSGGGSVFEGFAIYNALKRFPGTVTCVVDGLAASMASVIAMAGSKVLMASNSMLMIHNPSVGGEGDSAALRQAADILDKLKSQIIESYARTGIAPELLSDLMDKETWLTADEALEMGFCDEITKDVFEAKNIAADIKTAGFVHPALTPEPKEMDNPTPAEKTFAARFLALFTKAATVEDLTNQVESLKADSETLSANVVALNSEIETLKNTIAERDAKIAELEASQASVTQTADELVSEAAAQVEQVQAEAKTEIETAKAEVAEVAAALAIEQVAAVSVPPVSADAPIENQAPKLDSDENIYSAYKAAVEAGDTAKRDTLMANAQHRAAIYRASAKAHTA